ncbi:prepilin-type N-terminal cleavage/methylation domain-containing protein [Candidatus Gracilibacteria bacterium]|nr:prepilin-type N-terminal cleavage/methylation domain-containing protein [Candidatus Gracilibacteria bacterium]
MDQKNKKIKKYSQLRDKGFTLVELIIVITILAILATISFVSFQNYTKEARDSNRVTTLKTIEKGISLLETKSGYYPTPEESVEISSGNIVYVIQGIVGDNISREIKLNKTSKDPKTKNYYTYSTNLDKTRYQLGTYLENENYVYDRLINKVYAENEMKSFYTLGNKLGIFSTNTGVIINKTNYSSGKLDLSSDENNTEEFIVYFSNNKETGKYTGIGNALVGKVVETQESDGVDVGESSGPTLSFSGGSFKIDNGKSDTINQKVTLNITCPISLQGATEIKMSYGNSLDPNNYVSCVSGDINNFNLSSGTGSKTVYISFKDNLGNEIKNLSQNILLREPVWTLVSEELGYCCNSWITQYYGISPNTLERCIAQSESENATHFSYNLQYSQCVRCNGSPSFNNSQSCSKNYYNYIKQ